MVARVGGTLGALARAFENQDYDMATNGERHVLQVLGRVTPRATVVDVGAHRGEWAAMAAATLPEATIWAFEAVPKTYEKLLVATAESQRIRVHNLALGDQTGDIEFAVATGRDDLSSGVAGVHGELHHFDFTRVRCPMTTGERFCADHGIDRIDLLKIDVEGMEPGVIRGFASLLEQGRIGAVQFEYGQVNLQARFFLGDFYKLLGPYDMVIGKLYPNYVDFRDYHFVDDTLSGPNYLAVRRDNAAFLQALNPSGGKRNSSPSE